MGMEFREVTRGNQKIFIHLVPDEDESGIGFDAKSRTSAGHEVPARVIPAPEGVGGRVVVVPVTEDAQTIEVTARDVDGGRAETGVLVLDAAEARHQSQRNTLLRNRRALAIRNCDEGIEWGCDALVMEVLRCIDHGEEDILHVLVELRGTDQESLAAPCRLRLQSANGVSLILADPIVLGDSLAEDHDYVGYYHRRLLLSVRIPRATTSAVAWVSSKAQDIPDRVEFWDAGRFEEMRRKWFFDSLSADRDPIYDEWYRTRHRAKSWELEAQRAASFPGGPSFSVVVPLFHTPLEYFHDMAASVTGQTYPHWQLILVNATPDDHALGDAVTALAKGDARVRVVDLPRNLGIVGNTNEGINAASGDFVCFLDHDDALEPDVLFWYARALRRCPDTDVLYCDEDKLHDGRYEQAFFKPDWSPDLLRSQNYVTHFLAVRRSLIDEVGPLRPDYEGAQDHDLTLRATERARNVFHLRRIGYHWRISETSTAGASEAKGYASSAGCRAVQAQLDRLGVRADVFEDRRISGVYHERFRMEGEPLVSIVIPSKDASSLLSGLIDSILERTTYHNFEIVVIENGSTEEETFALYRRLAAADSRISTITYVPDGPVFNYAKLMNFGIARSAGEYVLMLNNDMKIITPDWIQFLLGHARERRVGCVGGKLLYPDDTIQHAGVIVHRGGPSHTGIYMPRDTDNYFHAAQVARNFLGVTGACLMVRREVFDEVGGLDESFAVDFNDVDFCLRVRDAGYWNVYEPQCEIYHFESVSRGKNDTPAKRVRFKWEGAKVCSNYPQLYEITDPYMNPNLWPINPYWHLDV